MTEVVSGNRDYIIRPATLDEVDILIDLRLTMFRAMGFDDEAVLHRVGEACRDYFLRHLPTGAFRVWVAEHQGTPVASIGLVLHSIPPSPKNLVGKEAYLMNLVTLPVWRHRGIARALLIHVLGILREEDIPVVSLHATADGRQLYEDLGFVVLEDVPEMILKLKP
ncbi:GNAT family N-acetyltransferase [Candidatus Bipolaricaulota bacterium]